MKNYKSNSYKLNTGNPDDKRKELVNYFTKTWQLEEDLYANLKNENTYYLRPDALRHPLIFYFGHTASFYINKLVVSKTIDQRLNAEMESIFAIGVDEMSWDDLNEKHYNWPSVAQTKIYRSKVKDVVIQVINSMPFEIPIDWDSPAWIILMGIEHTRIHIETSSVLMRQLPIDQITNKNNWKTCADFGENPENELLEIPEGNITLGKQKNDDQYGWDCEYGKLDVQTQAFEAAKYITSNGEFLAFVQAGGYKNQRFWTQEGWNWRTFKNAQMPTFWIQKEGKYFLRQLFEILELPLNFPVEVNFLEADAFCRWKSEKENENYRLPTEAEWYQLYYSANLPDIIDWENAPGNLNFEYFASTCPVNKFKTGKFYDLVGNVWQWTETPVDKYPGFRIHPAYDDFSVPTFDGRHNIFKGGSWISTGNEASKYARYAFRRHFFQHAGFRYIKSDKKTMNTETEYYETNELIAQYCEAHYGQKYFGVENFPKVCADICLQYTQGKPQKSALDIGCATGRTSFELAKKYDKVTGLDFSARFIQVAAQMQKKGKIKYKLPKEGRLFIQKEIQLSDFGLQATAQNAEFFQADACNMKPIFKGYDLIFAGNLIDRLYDPINFLAEIHIRLNKGGIFILTSPYTWLEEHTEKNKWLGGFVENGKEVSSFEGIKAILEKNFKLVSAPFKKEFVTRETQHKFQHSLSEFSVWELK